MSIINLKLPPFVAFAFVLGVAAIAGTLIFVVSQQPMPEQGRGVVVIRPSAAVNESAENELVNSPPTDALEGWKTYRTEAYKFEFQYPSDWYISECDDLSCIRVAARLRPLESDAPFQGIMFGGPSQYRTPEENRDESCDPEFFELDLGLSKVKALGCHGGIRVYLMNERTGEMTVAITAISVEKDRETARKILSTFKFIE